MTLHSKALITNPHFTHNIRGHVDGSVQQTAWFWQVPLAWNVFSPFKHTVTNRPRGISDIPVQSLVTLEKHVVPEE